MLKMSKIAAPKSKESISGITWWQWNSHENGRVEKLKFTREITDCFQQLEKLYTCFLRHTYIKGKGTHISFICIYLHLRMRWIMFNMTMKRLSFKLISLKILQIKYKMPSSHLIGFWNNLLYLLLVCAFIYFHHKKFSWLNKTINVMPEFRSGMLRWRNNFVPSTFVATS